MSNQRHIRRPVEDKAIGRVDRKRYTAKDYTYRGTALPIRENIKKINPGKEIKDTHEHDNDNNPMLEKIANPYNNDICQLCEHSRKSKGEWYCHQDKPVVRCYQILNCSVYCLSDEGVITSGSI